MDRFIQKFIKFYTFLMIFSCPLAATPTHIELRGKDLPQEEQGYMLPWQDVMASGFLREMVENGSEIENGMPLPRLKHSIIERYAPCLTIIAEGQRGNELPFVTEQRLREELRNMTDLYNAIIFADYLNVPLLLKAALAQAPAHITPANVLEFERLSDQHDYQKLCQNYIQAHHQTFMDPRELHTLQVHTIALTSAIFSPDGNTIATASHDRPTKLWDARTGQFRHTLKGHTRWVNSATFSPDGGTIVTAYRGSTVKLEDARTGKCLHTLKGHTLLINSAAFSPDGKTIVTTSVDKTAKLWDAHSGQLLHTLQGHSGMVNATAFSPDGSILASVSNDDIVKLWNARTGLYLHSLEGHNSFVTSAIFSPDGNTIVTTSWDKTAKIWNARTGQCLHTLKGHIRWVLSVAFSPDGGTIATSSYDTGVTTNADGNLVDILLDCTTKLWDARTGQFLYTLQGHINKVNAAAFSPNGRTIVTASDEGTARVWEVRTGKCLHTLRGHADWVHSAAFSPDGKTIVTASRDQTTKIWRLYPRELEQHRLVELLGLVEKAREKEAERPSLVRRRKPESKGKDA